jgi:DNA polymerase/3'-5' exonuclease PolX
MAKLDIAAVATLLQEIAQRMELAGGNPDRARAYGRAAENLALSPWHEIAHRRNMSRRSISHQRPDWLIVFCQHC